MLRPRDEDLPFFVTQNQDEAEATAKKPGKCEKRMWRVFCVVLCFKIYVVLLVLIGWFY